MADWHYERKAGFLTNLICEIAMQIVGNYSFITYSTQFQQIDLSKLC